MTAPRLSWLITSVAIAAGLHVAQAQPVDFSCPKPGTVEERGSYKTQYTGASQNDQYLCTSRDTWNKPQAHLFNFYRPEEFAGSDIRAGMQDLLAGRKTSVTFTLKSGSTETWTILRREQLSIEGRKFDTIVFNQDRERFPSSMHPFHGQYVRWLDAKNGLWVKATLNVISGETAMERKAYTDSSITIP